MEAVPLLDQMVGRLRPMLWMLFGAVVLVLLMACANVGNLLLARGIARERELAVRTALGADRGRLVREMLAESLLLAAVGGALGALLAVWGVDLLLARGPANLPRAAQVRVDGVVLAFGVGAALVSGLLFGLLPALTATSANPEQALRSTGASASPHPVRLRRWLVAVDVALALVLVSGAALLLRSFAQVVGVDPGFQPSGAVNLVVSVPRDEQGARAVFTAALQRLRELPGAVAVGGVDYQPLSGVANDQAFEVEGRPVAPGSQPPDEEIRVTTPGWFEAMGIPLLRGRPLSEVEKAPVLVINDAFARKYWPSGDPLGQRLRILGDDRWWTVVGVRGDVREFGLDAPVKPTLYVPFQLVAANSLSLVVRSRGARCCGRCSRSWRGSIRSPPPSRPGP
jgi:predicted permease